MCQLFTQHANTHLFHFKYLQNQKKSLWIWHESQRHPVEPCHSVWCAIPPLLFMSSIYTWDSDSSLSFLVITYTPDPPQGVTSLRPFLIFSYSHLLLPMGRGLGGWKWQGGDWEVTRSILLDPIICICPFSDTMTGTGPILKWIGGCLEGGELWQENISRLWHWDRLLVETNRYVIPQGQSEQSTCL